MGHPAPVRAGGGLHTCGMDLKTREDDDQRMFETLPLPKVAVLGGDPVVGHAIQALLQSAGYETRLVPGPFTADTEDALVDAGLLLIVPDPDCWSPDNPFAHDVKGSAAGGAPILELVPFLGEVEPVQGHQIPWPCRLEDLQQKIEEILSATRSGRHFE